MLWLTRCTRGAVAAVALSAFALAFFNVMALAVANGIPPDRAWLVPIIVEGTMVALALTRLEAEINGRKTHWHTAFVALFVLVAIALNVAHSGHEMSWGMFIAGLQPVSLLVAFEALMYQLRHQIADDQQAVVNPLQTRLIRAVRRVACLRRQVGQLQATINQQQTTVTDLQAQNAQLFEANKELQQLGKRWQAIGKEAQTIIMLNAGEINEQEAVEQAGLDVRTIRTWSGRLNGVN